MESEAQFKGRVEWRLTERNIPICINCELVYKYIHDQVTTK
jgi:hypothetical protein